MNDQPMNIDARPPRIPNASEPPAIDFSAGNIESSPSNAPDATPPAVFEPQSPPGFIPPARSRPDDDSLQPPLSARAGNDAADEAHQLPAATMKEAPAAFDPAMFAAFAADPANRRELEHMLALARHEFHMAVEKVYSMLTPETITRPATPVLKAPNNIRMLMVAQRQGEILSRERRAVAEGIVVGSVINVDNPEWNPMVPETDKAESQSAMATLLRMET